MSVRQQLESRIRNDFTYHKPDEGSIKAMESLRNKARELALMILDEVPMGREQASALTRLEEVVMHANAGIARQCPAEVVNA